MTYLYMIFSIKVQIQRAYPALEWYVKYVFGKFIRQDMSHPKSLSSQDFLQELLLEDREPL